MSQPPWGAIVALSTGGVIGVNARYWLGFWVSRWIANPFPWATFAINISGSFAIGFLTILLTRWLPHPNFRLALLVGFLGGYTTFSTYMFDSLALWERGEIRLALANVAGSTLAGLLAVGLGVGLARTLIASSKNADSKIGVKVDPQGPAMPISEPGSYREPPRAVTTPDPSVPPGDP